MTARRKSPEQGRASGQPTERLLENRDSQSPGNQVAGGERGEGAVHAQVRPKQSRRGPDAGLVEDRSQQARRQVDHGGRRADQRQGRGDHHDPLWIERQLQMADLTARRDCRI